MKVKVSSQQSAATYFEFPHFLRITMLPTFCAWHFISRTTAALSWNCALFSNFHASLRSKVAKCFTGQLGQNTLWVGVWSFGFETSRSQNCSIFLTSIKFGMEKNCQQKFWICLFETMLCIIWYWYGYQFQNFSIF